LDSPFTPYRVALGELRFLLVSVVPFQVDDAGTVWIDRLWHHDLMAHLEYIPHLAVLAPQEAFGRPGDLVAVPSSGMARLQFRALPASRSFAAALLGLPRMFRVARAEVRRCDVVHSCVAGWPLPPGLVVNPLAVASGKPMMVVIESAFWRLSGPGPHGRKARWRAALTERLARWSVRHARMAVFTHAGYRDQFPAGESTDVVVAPASWVSEADVLSEASAVAAWSLKPAEVRFLLPARLVEAKCIHVLLQALEAADREGESLCVDIMGEGPLREAAERAAASMRHVRLAVLDPVPYGPAFMATLRRYHAVIVPSISDEQPRILFDAFSQSVPVVASDTPGHRDLVRPGVEGLLFPPGDAGELLRTLSLVARDPVALRQRGLAARQTVGGRTHQSMHLTRAMRLASAFGTRT
jgi:hypothetical protein